MPRKSRYEELAKSNLKELGLREDYNYLYKQLIRYQGNKKYFLVPLNNCLDIIKKDLNKTSLKIFDAFSGTGAVSRMCKEHASYLVANDFMDYSYKISKTYLTNKSEIVYPDLLDRLYFYNEFTKENNYGENVIRENYAPKDKDNIQKDERAYFTPENARRLDTYRNLIDNDQVFMGVLLYKASWHVNSAGFFAGFFKKDGVGSFLEREYHVKRDIELEVPYLSNFDCDYNIYKLDLCKDSVKESFDVTYLDPPYNSTAYGNKYHLLNVISENKLPEEVTEILGTDKKWKRSTLNKRVTFLEEFKKVLDGIDSKYFIVSFNDSGFIDLDSMEKFLEGYGEVSYFSENYRGFKTGKLDSYKKAIERFFLVRRK